MGRVNYTQQAKRTKGAPISEKAAAALRILSRRSSGSGRNTGDNRSCQAQPLSGEFRVEVSSGEGERGKRKVFVTHSQSPSPPRASYAETTKKGLTAAKPTMRREIYNGKGKLVFIEDGNGWKTAARRISPKREEKTATHLAAPKGFRFTSDGEVEPSCYNCGQWGHWKNDCIKETKCYFCKGKGHLAKHCKIKFASEQEDVSVGSGASNASLEAKDQRFHTRSGGIERPERLERSEPIHRPSPPPLQVVARAMVEPSVACEDLEKRMRFNALATVKQGNPDEETIRLEFARRWPKTSYWEWHVKRFNASTFLIPCSSEARLQMVMSKDSLSGSDFTVSLSRWSLNFGEFDREGLESSWFIFTNFPTPCWHMSGFQDLVKSFGWVEEVDPATRHLQHLEFARVRVSFLRNTVTPTDIYTSYKGKCFLVKSFREAEAPPLHRRKAADAVHGRGVWIRDQSNQEDEGAPLDLDQGPTLQHNPSRPSKGKEIALQVSEREPSSHVPWVCNLGPSDPTPIACDVSAEGRDRVALQGQHLQHLQVVRGSENQGEMSPFHQKSNIEVESSSQPLRSLLNQSMAEAFFKFLKGDISALSGEQLANWEKLLSSSSEPKRPLPFGSVYSDRLVSPSKGSLPNGLCEQPIGHVEEPSLGLTSPSKVGQAFTTGPNITKELDSDEESLSQMLKDAGINMGGINKAASERFGETEIRDLTEDGDSMLTSRDRDEKSGFDSPTDDDLIDALKEVDEASPLEGAAKAWGLESAKGKSRFVGREDLRRSIRQQQKYGGKTLSKDDMIASAAKSKLPTSVCSGSPSLSVSIISFLPDSFVIALSKACGLNLGQDLETQLMNVSILRDWISSSNN